jgi:hypothetical protein
MRKILLVTMLLLAVNNVFAQAPNIQWAKCYGGSFGDNATSILPTKDGGYIIAGGTFSNDGDVIGHHGADSTADVWIVKIDDTGAIKWQKSLGSIHMEGANSMAHTSDGGYIVAGYASSNGGIVSGNHGNVDYWVVKIDDTGAIQWQKSYGGTNYDVAFSIIQTKDSGYVVAGSSFSNDGDVTGHHGSNIYPDYWIVKLDDTGIIEWQKSLGGTNNDDATSILQTSDGGYIVAGYSSSNDGDVVGHHVNSMTITNDYWVVKLDGEGVIQWQKSLGGKYEDEATIILPTKDGGYIVGGGAASNDGDVTGHHGSTYIFDCWVVKINDTGAIQWQKSFGGSNADEVESIKETNEGGYIVAGYSRSNDGDATINHGNNGSEDFWVVKLDDTGSLQWQKSLGGSVSEIASSVLETADSGYIVAGGATSFFGDISGHHGISGNSDCWVVKLKFPTGIEELSTTTLILTPNPVKDILTISLAGNVQEKNIEVIDCLGRVIQNSKFKTQNCQLSTANWVSGLYLVRCTMQDGSVVTGKVVKE